MTDTELLEFVAKAEGRILTYRTPFIEGRESETLIVGWNPLMDDGDAFKLSVKLGLVVSAGHQTYTTDTDTWHAWAMTEDDMFYNSVEYSKSSGDAYAATRRAIVLAAVDMGKAFALTSRQKHR